MDKIPKYRTKYLIPQPKNIRPSQKDYNKEYLVQKITQKTIKFNENRQFGKDLTNSIKENNHNNYNNHTTKIVKIINKNSNNNIYIKKHSFASQASQKNPQLKIDKNDTKIRENNSGLILNKRPDISSSQNNYRNNNNINHEYIPLHERTKMLSSISFGNNNNIRPLSSVNNNFNSMRLSNPKSNVVYDNLNNKNISIYYNDNFHNNNTKIEMTHSNLDLV